MIPYFHGIIAKMEVLVSFIFKMGIVQNSTMKSLNRPTFRAV